MNQVNLNPTSPAGLKLLSVLQATALGAQVQLEDFGALCPAFGEDCIGRLTEIQSARDYYDIKVTWFGIPVCSVRVECKRQTLVLEVV